MAWPMNGVEMDFDPDLNDMRLVPRIRATEAWIRAIEGLWELDGQHYWLGEDADSGTIRAISEDGDRINPVLVISRGRRVSKF